MQHLFVGVRSKIHSVDAYFPILKELQPKKSPNLHTAACYFKGIWLKHEMITLWT